LERGDKLISYSSRKETLGESSKNIGTTKRKKEKRRREYTKLNRYGSIKEKGGNKKKNTTSFRKVTTRISAMTKLFGRDLREGREEGFHRYAR